MSTPNNKRHATEEAGIRSYDAPTDPATLKAMSDSIREQIAAQERESNNVKIADGIVRSTMKRWCNAINDATSDVPDVENAAFFTVDNVNKVVRREDQLGSGIEVKPMKDLDTKDGALDFLLEEDWTFVAEPDNENGFSVLTVFVSEDLDFDSNTIDRFEKSIWFSLTGDEDFAERN